MNGKRLEPLTTPLSFHLPEKHIQPKFVIGARWAGSVLKYSDYFHGKISGLMLKAGFITDEDVRQYIFLHFIFIFVVVVRISIVK